MKYDFETVMDRTGSGSAKWNLMRAMAPGVPAGIVPLSVADMEFKNPPEIIEGLKAYLDHAVLGYAAPTHSFYEAVLSWTKRRYGWETKKEWLITTPGVINGFFHGVRAFTEPGDGVILLTPSYPPFFRAANDTGRTLVRCPLVYKNGAYSIDFALLERLAAGEKNKLLILSNPHNPVGRVWTREELLRLGEICLANGVFVISDEIHCDLIMPGNTFTSFASISPEFEKYSMTCIAPSKTFNLAGMQASCIFVPDEKRRERYLKAMAGIHQENRLNALAYKSTEIAYTRCDEWLSQLIGVIDENRRTLKDFMAGHCPEVGVVELQGTYLQWIDVHAFGMDPEEQERIMTREGYLFLDEGSMFGPEGDGFERINLACPKPVLMDALKRFEKLYQKYVKESS